MNRAEATSSRILVLDSGAGAPSDLIDMLRNLGEVVVQPDRGAALSALERDHYDFVVSPAGDFQPATAGQLGLVLDHIGQGVCIVDLQGHVLWSNAKLAEFSDEVRERIRQCCLENYGLDVDSPIRLRPRSLSLVTDGERYYDATVTPIVEPDESVTRLVAVVSDVTRARRLQQKMDAIDNAGRELVRVDADRLAKLDVRQRLEILEQKILRFTRELLEFDNFAIRLLDKKSGKLELILCAGLPLESQQIDIFASTENNGISGYVAATGRSYICPDVRQDARYLPGISDARSSLTVPLRLHDQIIGILNIESVRAGAFSEDDRQFAEIFGRYVAIALHILDLLVVERHTTTGRLADNVSTEIAAPLCDILAEASTLMEDYIGHDDMRHRLQAIVDNVTRVRESVKQVVKPTKGILGARPTQPEADPLLEGKTVLVIDDEEIIRATVQDVLAKKGCDVDTARDGDEAVAMIHCRDYDLIISDIRMPGKNGYQIYSEVKDRAPACPVIFMTGFGYDPNHSIIRARAEGLAAVLFKPFKVDQLLDDVRNAVAAPPSGTET